MSNESAFLNEVREADARETRYHKVVASFSKDGKEITGELVNTIAEGGKAIIKSVHSKTIAIYTITDKETTTDVFVEVPDHATGFIKIGDATKVDVNFYTNKQATYFLNSLKGHDARKIDDYTLAISVNEDGKQITGPLVDIRVADGKAVYKNASVDGTIGVYTLKDGETITEALVTRTYFKFVGSGTQYDLYLYNPKEDPATFLNKMKGTEIRNVLTVGEIPELKASLTDDGKEMTGKLVNSVIEGGKAIYKECYGSEIALYTITNGDQTTDLYVYCPSDIGFIKVGNNHDPKVEVNFYSKNSTERFLNWVKGKEAKENSDNTLVASFNEDGKEMTGLLVNSIIKGGKAIFKNRFSDWDLDTAIYTITVEKTITEIYVLRGGRGRCYVRYIQVSGESAVHVEFVDPQ